MKIAPLSKIKEDIYGKNGFFTRNVIYQECY